MAYMLHILKGLNFLKKDKRKKKKYSYGFSILKSIKSIGKELNFVSNDINNFREIIGQIILNAPPPQMNSNESLIPNADEVNFFFFFFCICSSFYYFKYVK